MSRRVLAALIAFNLLGSAYLIVDRVGDSEPAAAVEPVSAEADVPTTAAEPTTTESPPPETTTTTVPPTTTTVAPEVARSAPFRGLGAWVDVFDFSPGYMQEGETTPVVTPADVDFLADIGVKTLYIQASRDDERTPGDLESPQLLAEFVRRAHARGVQVVAWYLPKLYDESDLRRLRAMRDFQVDGRGFDAIGLDIEFRGAVPDTAERNSRLVGLSEALRAEVGDLPLAAVVLPPVVTDIVNLNFWPQFPWQHIAPYFDVWMPMGYWTNRRADSGWRDAHRYTQANVDMIRQHLGDPDAPVHPIGGIGDAATLDDYRAFIEAAHATNSIGASIYDYRTTVPDAWQILIGSPG